MRGIFITIEGPDGSGKSTQIDILKTYLENKGYDVLLTREPGGTAISEEIRKIILNKDFTAMGHITELLLYTSARAQLVEEIIRPALDKGKAVICDRFVDSTAVYQGLGRGLGVEMVYDINEYALNGVAPDITLLLDLDAKEGIKRKKNQAELDRMELESIDFHEKVVEGYRMLARLNPDRIKVIDATLSIEDISENIIDKITKIL